MINKMYKIKETVKELLTKRPELRDDDNRLIANIYLIEAGGVKSLQQMSAQDFLLNFTKGFYSSPESIRRVRQKLQEDFPELRGKKYNERKKTGNDTSNGIKYL
jgi:hypothetical protein